METLFRAEVLQARRTSWLGPISLAQPLALRVLAGLAVLAAVVIVVFLLTATYTRRSHVHGLLVPVDGMATVLAPATGILARLDLQEGSRVEAGQTVAVVTVPRATLVEGDTQTALAARMQRRRESLDSAYRAQEALLDAQHASLSIQLASAKRELVQVEQEIALRRQQAALASDTLERLERLHGSRFASDQQVSQQRATALDTLSQVQALERQSLASSRQIAQLEQALRELPGQRESTRAGLQRELALLEQEQLETLARGELAITAPVDGVIATPVFKPGQAVQAGQPLLSILPGNGELEAELYVPSRAIGFIEPGDRVLLRYQAYPYQKFGHHEGRVARISRSTLDVAPGTGQGAANEPLYRINVALERQTITAYGKAEPLKPGMVLDAHVLGETRTLIEWVLEPLYSLKGSVFGR